MVTLGLVYEGWQEGRNTAAESGKRSAMTVSQTAVDRDASVPKPGVVPGLFLSLVSALLSQYN